MKRKEVKPKALIRILKSLHKPKLVERTEGRQNFKGDRRKCVL